VRPIDRRLLAALTGAVLVAAITLVIALLEPGVPALGLGALYLLAVVPVALLYGPAAAAAVSVASMAAFSYFCLPPHHNLDPGSPERWSGLAALLVSSLVVGQLTARAQREARRSARLAAEQAALGRVATLVARAVPPSEVFAAVAREVGLLLGVGEAHLARYGPDGTATVTAAWSSTGENVAVGSRVELEGLRSSAGAPIVVERRVWGVLATTSTSDPLPADTEARLASFAELVATAISNADARTEVAASRARIVAAADDERRRVVRDLHDGAQQQLINTIITLKLAEGILPSDQENVPALLTEALDHAEQANISLRELAHGILPTVLAKGGLRAGVDALASRTPVPVDADVSVGTLPTVVEATAYFVVAEALTNIAKHAHAEHAEVTARIADGTLGVQVRDDGIGGARPDGTGLLGLADRLAAIDGELRVESPAGGGTLVAASIPLPA
jgi:signal transduction histidine kinase